MRHQNSGRQLGRNSSHRKAMYRNMSASLVQHELIKTTHAKAKELRRVVEPLITISKEDTVSKRRLVFDRIRDKKAVAKLFNELGPRFKSRPGGYLRILKCGFRAGDNAPMAIVELVDRQLINEEETVVTEQPKRTDKSAAKKEQPHKQEAVMKQKAEAKDTATPNKEANTPESSKGAEPTQKVDKNADNEAPKD